MHCSIPDRAVLRCIEAFLRTSTRLLINENLTTLAYAECHSPVKGVIMLASLARFVARRRVVILAVAVAMFALAGVFSYAVSRRVAEVFREVSETVESDAALLPLLVRAARGRRGRSPPSFMRSFAYSGIAVTDPVERLRACGHAYVQFGLANPEHYRILFMAKPTALPSGVNMEELLLTSGFTRLVAAVDEAIE